ncbi:MAG: family 1 glycosylhydrolase [Bifidobacteriaceae bacterium]|nr:family 1 glycosylhydrolase [Bifidobacteriaceae bacterium]
MAHSFKFQNNFRLGVATASTQIEGSAPASNWLTWAEQGHIKDGSSPTNAGGHWKKWKEDANLMQKMGLQIYRMSIDWARVEPEPHHFDTQVLQRYLDEILYLKKVGIETLVTLHHFSNPKWFEEIGGWAKKANAKYFLEFAEKTVELLYPQVQEFVTFNEPNVYTVFGYFYGDFPPGKKSLWLTSRVLSVLAATHIRLYIVLHQRYPNIKIGIAHHLRVYRAKRLWNPFHHLFKFGIKHFFNTTISKAFVLGRFGLFIRNLGHFPRGEYADFWGINYYSRSTVSSFADGVKQPAPINDLGWEIYPKGIAQVCKTAYRLLPRPLFITENGTCDNRDTFRSKYLYDHLRVIAKAQAKLPIERYYHWCFCDNFEWLEGESARFGLVHMDYTSQKRTIKSSGKFFSKIISQHGVNERMYAKYAKKQVYPTN